MRRNRLISSVVNLADQYRRFLLILKFPWPSKSSSGIKLDLAASLTGSAWAMLVQVACVPLYIRFLGIEAYGLIGFYLMLQAMLQVLDLGVSPTINRALARYSVQPGKANEARDLVRTLEVGYWLVGIVASLALIAASPGIAAHWIKSGAIPVRTVTQALTLMGVLAAFQWPVSFYQGGLMGLHKQVLFNVLRIISATVSNGGAVLVLWLVSSTIQAFFLWLIAANAIIVALWTSLLWRNLPVATRATQFDFSLVRNTGRFAAGMSGIVAFSLILGQADKVILSRVFSLRVFSYYTIGGMFGAGLVMIVSSVFSIIYPRLSALVAQGDEQEIIRLYHGSTQLMAVLILPLATVLALFSTDILQLWTRNVDVARHAGPIATLLVAGSAVNGLMNLPYALQLAYGWTSLGLTTTISLTIVVIPALLFMATHYGAVGAAFVFFGLQMINMLVGLPLTHRRLLQHEMTTWLLRDVGPPLAASLLAVGIARVIIPGEMSPVSTLAILVAVLLAALVAAASLAPYIRERLLTKLSTILVDYA
jgi:O-antigen/teichoic acid export membrane protein